MMTRKISSWVKSLFAAVLGLLIVLVSSSPNLATNILPNHQTPTQIATQQIQAAYTKLPLSFEANVGQTDASVKFLSHGHGGHLYLTPTEAVLTLTQPQLQSNHLTHKDSHPAKPTVNTSSSVVRMQLIGANPSPQITGVQPLPTKVNYFLGNDPKHWHTNIPTYAQVKYQQVYPGVDMVYYGNQQQLEYDFVVAPRADPNLIKLAFAGVDKVSVNPEGNLTLLVGTKLVQLHKPVVYQKVNGTKQVIANNNYLINSSNIVSFDLGKYDRTRPLIIDPVLSYSTYLGGSSNDYGNGIAVDRVGNAYITGSTQSTNFPTQNPLQAAYGGDGDAFITKLNLDGDALVYSTYLGGSNLEVARSIAVDRAGNAYITGNTRSTNFPTQNPLQAAFGGGYNNAFITKLNHDGDALVYSTYLGGSISDSGSGIAVDRAGNVYITGNTNSTNFPTQNPLQAAYGGGINNAFITKLNHDGDALVYSTY
ncbi:MAG: SBBP repeat-containing protein, partial [Rhizonema sp. NSF051]|nr:SBBP repeat-containing protein [Rhizonema sp. NSF051]